MKAFKKVLDFAAKDQVTPDTQRDWQQWVNANQKKAKLDESEEQANEDEKHARIDSAEKDDKNDWVVLEDKEGKKYRFNKTTGETNYEGLSDDSDDSEENDGQEDVEADEYKLVDDEDNAPKRPQVPPQVWEKLTDSLTRKSKWYCAEVDVTLHRPPPEHPWRAVKLPDGKHYFWNTETNETKWE